MTARVSSRRLALAALVAAAGLAAIVFLAVAMARARLVAPEPTLLVRDRAGRHLGEIGDPRDAELGYWPLAELPPRVVAATVALEDRRFDLHGGIDPLAVARALAQNLSSGRRISGASTLAMQVARMQHPGPRTLPRKALEAATAALMTARHGRRAVLAHYLRLAPYGNRIRGIAFAARRYLDKPVEDLSWAEIAFLAAIPQAPSRMNPFHPLGRRRAIERGRRLLGLLAQQGVIGREELDLALDQIATLRPPPRDARPLETLHALERIREQVSADGGTSTLVMSSIDLDAQRRVAARVGRAVGDWEPNGVGNAAVIVVELATGEVRAWVGSAGYFDRDRRGAIDYARVPRSPGSTLKPFLYALALDQGTITPATILDDLGRGPGGISNADDDFLGPLLPRVALANSRNVPAVELLARVGVPEALELLRRLGLHDGSGDPRGYGLGLAVGGLPVTLERLVTAYTALAGDGRMNELVLVPGMATDAPRRVLSEDAVRAVTLFLSDPLARLPSFARMGALEYPFPVAVKTGTSPQTRDAWTIAYSRRWLVGAWVGRHDWRPMERVSGYGTAAWLARGVLLDLHGGAEREGLEDVSFPPPSGARPLRLCALTGLPASPLCERTITEWLLPDRFPAAECDAHVRLAVDRRTGGPAGPGTPPGEVGERALTLLPPRYTSWAVRAGIALVPLGGLAELAASAAQPRTPAVRIVSPRAGTRLMRDPETPPALATLGLEAVVDPPSTDLLWLVDGAPFAVAARPYSVRWPLVPGRHTFEARVPFTDAVARPVTVVVAQ